jgi:hypothetical protein
MHAHLVIAAEQLTNANWLLIFEWADSLKAQLCIGWSKSRNMLVILCEQLAAPTAVRSAAPASAPQTSRVAQRWWHRAALAVSDWCERALEAAVVIVLGEDLTEERQAATRSHAEAEARGKRQLADTQLKLQNVLAVCAAQAAAIADVQASAAAGSNLQRERLEEIRQELVSAASHGASSSAAAQLEKQLVTLRKTAAAALAPAHSNSAVLQTEVRAAAAAAELSAECTKLHATEASTQRLQQSCDTDSSMQSSVRQQLTESIAVHQQSKAKLDAAGVAVQCSDALQRAQAATAAVQHTLATVEALLQKHEWQSASKEYTLAQQQAVLADAQTALPLPAAELTTAEASAAVLHSALTAAAAQNSSIDTQLTATLQQVAQLDGAVSTLRQSKHEHAVSGEQRATAAAENS